MLLLLLLFRLRDDWVGAKHSDERVYCLSVCLPLAHLESQTAEPHQIVCVR